jgi:hypothetical protein
MNLQAQVTCPHCFQPFYVPAPLPNELPAQVDYDCEICCRPLIIDIDYDAAEEAPFAEARKPDE